MANLYPDLPHSTALEVEALSRSMYDLRENRKRILHTLAVDSEDALLTHIHAHRMDEHLAYEYWLAAQILAESAESARNRIARLLAGDSDDAQTLPLHLRLMEMLTGDSAIALAAVPSLTQDALLIPLPGNIELCVRYATADAYSLRWRVGDGDFCIDTAPCHPRLSTWPNHLHTPDGAVLPDPLGDPAQSPERKLTRLIEVLSVDPTLGTRC